MSPWFVVLVAILFGEFITLLAFVSYVRDKGIETTFPDRPNQIFRYVHREDRAAYVRIQRRTYSVAMRDLTRQMNKLARTIGKELLPVMQRTISALNSIFHED